MSKSLSLVLFLAGPAAAPLTAVAAPAFADDFEDGLRAWTCDWPGKAPLLLRRDPVAPANQCAYSGPPGKCRVARHDFAFPVTGRIELRFFDDMAPAKNQMAGVGDAGNELLGIACTGGTHYRYRIGKTYYDTPVPRSKGWHRFAWEIDGRRTTAFIDGRRIAADNRLGAVRSLFIGSFWDASTGWYDDVRVRPAPPSDAPPLVQAEDFFLQAAAPEGAAVRVQRKAGAVGQAVTHWDNTGHSLTWLVKPPADGKALLLLKFAVARPGAVRLIRCGRTAVEHTFPSTGGWERWAFVAIPVETDGSPVLLTMVNRKGGLNLDWLALVPSDLPEPQVYARNLDWLARARNRLTTAWKMTAACASAAKVEIDAPAPSALDLDPLPGPDRIAALRSAQTKSLETARQRVLEALAPTLESQYRPRQAAVGPRETALARECYGRLLRYVRLTAPRFRDWSYAPGCRFHKREGHLEWDVRQNATVALGYAALLRGPYEPTVSGVPRERIAADLIGLLRTLALTHRANFLPTGDGNPWGDQWQSAFWAGIAGQAAWLVWDRLPDDVRIMTARMIEHEADRFNTRPPDSGYRGDTKAEENAWNSEVIALAACMFPNHPRHGLWQERAIVYMLNSFVRKSDLVSNRIVDGKPLNQRLTAVTIYPDFTLENHERVHPDYLACGSLLLRNALLYHAGDMPLPQSMFFNMPETYEVVKRLTAANGSCFYVNGQDWWPHRIDVPLLVSACSSVLSNDPEAAFLERACLESFGRMHARFEDGRAWDTREYNYANAEEEMIARYAELFLLHRAFGDGPTPLSRAEFLRRRTGVYIYETGGFATQRTPEKFVSFAWVNGAMGLIFTGDDTWFTSPYERGLTGSIRCTGLPDSRPRVTEHRAAATDGRLTVTARISRCDGAIEQSVALLSFQDRPVVWIEQWRALRPIEVEWVGSGALGFLNEDAPGISENRHTLIAAAGAVTVVGASKQPERTLDIRSAWINIDGRLGVIGTGRIMQYHDANRYRRSRLEEVLWPLVETGVGRVAQGAVFHTGAILIVPGQPAAETANERFRLENAGNGILAVRLGDGRTVVVNLGRARATATVFGETVTLAPLESRP
ncbi:MAG: hypothetical protein GXP31_02420 [Kiritimatiellaeota bacterium]|nr:hypothetical protein [Kiritimatiellota bacterium]